MRYSKPAIAAAAVLAGLVHVPSASALRPLSLGFVDSIYSSSDPAARAAWLDRSQRSGATIVRLGGHWGSIAPTRPTNPDDPGDPAYQFAQLDAAVKDARMRGLEVLLTVAGAPPYAEGPGAGAAGGTGTWRPDPGALGSFFGALARRYSGTFPDPSSGKTLPRVRYWQVWNEPNLQTHLAPQGRRGSPGPSATHYRRMLNASYGALKSVDGGNVVVTAGTAPYGDRTGRRTRPAAFWRELLCLSGRELARKPCPDPARFDAFAHHPYGVGSPSQHAFGRDDVAIPDLGKLNRIVRAALRSGRALPRSRKPLWITEVSWDSRPPDPDGVRARTHARWLAEAFHLLWRQGAEVITWFQVRDAPPRGGYGASYQSGVYFLDGRPKRAERAFRFPFVVKRTVGGGALAWGKAPGAGRVDIQGRARGRWRTLARARTGRTNLFRRRMRVGRGTVLRAVAGARASLPWAFR